MTDKIKPEVARMVDMPELTEAEIDYITKAVFYAPKPQKSDAMLVFGAPEGDWRSAADAFKTGLVPLIVASGSVHERTHGVSEARLIKQNLIAQGVPEIIIVEDDAPVNTLENVTSFKQILQQRDIEPKAILFLSLRHHAGRCYLTLRQQFPEAIITATTHSLLSSGLDVAAHSWFKNPDTASRVYAEYQRILLYSARGDIALPNVITELD